MFQGHIDLNAAILFERGLYWASGRAGVVDLVAAHKWFNLAALKGHAEAPAMRREVAALMSEIEIVAAQRDARAWMTVQ
jgi:TPR repeat protein